MSDNTMIRTFHVRNSEKCYRFKPEAIMNHAPDHRGIYELVTFDQNQNPQVLYVGAAFQKSIQQSLESHLNGTIEPKANDLIAQYQNLYFDFLAELDAKSVDDAQDVYWWLVQKYKPVYNDLSTIQPSARAGEIQVIEQE